MAYLVYCANYLYKSIEFAIKEAGQQLTFNNILRFNHFRYCQGSIKSYTI